MATWVGVVVALLVGIGLVIFWALKGRPSGSGAEYDLGEVSQDWLKGRQAHRRDDR